ncbi:DUF397 domain-containing protein [Streptomyces sp. NPDC003077]|uniref:DUF397 domain-containing protein n=1 Tax=Streptomyces sp. NPDC003077 TaxID=3154443 RepID=UPI0033ACBB50
MNHLAWQRSSFSGGSANNCVEVALAAGHQMAIRESTTPEEIITTDTTVLAALLHSVKSGHLD